MIQLVTWIYSGLEKQKTGQIFTSKLSFRFLLQVFEAVVRERFLTEENEKKLKSLIRRTGRANSRRNKIIHSWYVEGVSGKVTRSKVELNKGYKFTAEEMTVKQLNDFADRVAKLSAEVLEFSWALYP